MSVIDLGKKIKKVSSVNLNIKSFRALRIFKAIRVLRMIRILRSMEYISMIFKSLEMSGSNFISICFLVIISFNNVYFFIDVYITRDINFFWIDSKRDLL